MTHVLDKSEQEAVSYTLNIMESIREAYEAGKLPVGPTMQSYGIITHAYDTGRVEENDDVYTAFCQAYTMLKWHRLALKKRGRPLVDVMDAIQGIQSIMDAVRH